MKYRAFVTLLLFLLLTSIPSYAQNLLWSHSTGTTYQGPVYCIDGDTSKTVYCSGGNGVLRSTDGGYTWTSAGLQGHSIICLAHHGSTIVAGAELGIYRSSDSGVTWKQAVPVSHQNWDSATMSSMIYHNGVFFAGNNDPNSSGNIFISYDDGMTWVDGELNNIFIGALAIDNYGVSIFAGTNKGVFVSSNNGASWQADTVGLPKSAVVALASVDGEIIAGSYYGVSISVDGGKTWILQNNGLVNHSIFTLAFYDQRFFAGTNDGIYRQDGQWTKISTTDMPPSGLSLGISNNLLLGGTNGGVFVTTDMGSNWSQTDNGLTGITSTSIAAFGTTIIAGTWSGIFRSDDNGGNWVLSDSGITDQTINSVAFSGDTAIAITQGGHIFLSTDLGLSWMEQDTGIGVGKINSVVTESGSWFAATDHGVFYSTNGGATWSQQNIPSSGGNFSWLSVDGSAIFAVNSLGIFRGDNNGSVWSKPAGNATPTGVQSIAAIDSVVIAATNNGFERSTDLGVTWSLSGLETHFTYLVFANNGIFYASSDSGVFRSTDKGVSWQSQFNGLPTPYEATSFAANSTTIFAGTFGYGMYSSPLIVNSVSESSPATLSSIKIFPDPAQSFVTVRWNEQATTEQSAIATIEIDNLLGAPIRTVRTSGTSTTLDVSSLPTGSYIIRVQGLPSAPLVVLR